jgi:hypothetical protein
MNQDPTSYNRSGLITYPPYIEMATVAGYCFSVILFSMVAKDLSGILLSWVIVST